MNHEAFKKAQMTATRQEGCKSLHSLALQAAGDTGPYFSYFAHLEPICSEKLWRSRLPLSKRVRQQMTFSEIKDTFNKQGLSHMQSYLRLSICMPLERSFQSLYESWLEPCGLEIAVRLSSLRENSVWATSCSQPNRKMGNETVMESRHGRSRAHFTSSLTRPEIRKKKVNPDLGC